MATINDFKREISELVKAQKVAKRINHQSEVYRNRGLLHAMYVAYYILKHKLVGDAHASYMISIGSVFCGWASSSVGLEHYSDKVGVIGSSPILPTS